MRLTNSVGTVTTTSGGNHLMPLAPQMILSVMCKLMQLTARIGPVMEPGEDLSPIEGV